MSAAGPLKGRHALVTGAGSGIGAAVARALVGVGARVSLAARRRMPLEAVAASLSSGMTQILDDFDVTDATAVTRGVEIARQNFGPVSILINNAGEAPSAPFEKTDQALWSRVLSVDLTGVYLVSQAVLADLKKHGLGARLINVAYTAGLTCYAYVAAYCAAKHGVVRLRRALALDLARSGVTVNAVCPGFTETPLIERAVATIVAKTGRSNETAKAELANRTRQVESARPPGDAGRGRRRRALACFTWRIVDHRPGSRGRRWGDHGRMSEQSAMQAARCPICMITSDFRRAFETFARKQEPTFGGD